MTLLWHGAARAEEAKPVAEGAVTYEEMGLLAEHRSPSWYDPGRFWSGDELDLAPGFHLGGEIVVALSPAPGTTNVPLDGTHRQTWRPRLRLPGRRSDV